MFKRISPIPIQIWLSTNDNIEIHQYIGMSQDANAKQGTCLSLVIFIYWACERQGNIFLVLRLQSPSGKCVGKPERQVCKASHYGNKQQ